MTVRPARAAEGFARGNDLEARKRQRGSHSLQTVALQERDVDKWLHDPVEPRELDGRRETGAKRGPAAPKCCNGAAVRAMEMEQPKKRPQPTSTFHQIQHVPNEIRNVSGVIY
jgi:hypothetical protein